ncbi:MAG: ribbon-helix-helix domain-containing protein [Cyanobacteriota bacterium]
MRRPRKISITIPQAVYESLLVQSQSQGRSLSSLASYWLQLQVSRGDPSCMDFVVNDVVGDELFAADVVRIGG